MTTKDGLSVIVPTAGRPQALERSLASLAKQDFDRRQFEILVVENGISQGAEATVHKIREEHPSLNCRHLHEPVPGLLAGRHRGLREARYELLVYIDDDIEAEERWLSAISNQFRDTSVQLVGGRNLPHYEVPPPEWLDSFWIPSEVGGVMCAQLSLSDLGGDRREIDANYIWGLNFAIRREALLDLGGFHPDGVPPALLQFRGNGETGLTMKAKQYGYRALYEPLAVVRHVVPASRLTAAYFAQRSFAQGISDSFTAIRELGKAAECTVLAPVERLESRMLRFLKDPAVHGRRFLARRWQSLFDKRKPRESSVLPCQSIAIRAKMAAAYREGYAFHQSSVASVPGLLEWVLRKDYWDYSLPDISIILPPAIA